MEHLDWASLVAQIVKNLPWSINVIVSLYSGQSILHAGFRTLKKWDIFQRSNYETVLTWNRHIRNRGIVEIIICLDFIPLTAPILTPPSHTWRSTQMQCSAVLEEVITPDTLAYSWSLPSPYPVLTLGLIKGIPDLFLGGGGVHRLSHSQDMLFWILLQLAGIEFCSHWTSHEPISLRGVNRKKVPEVVPLQANLQQEAEGKWREESSRQRLLMSWQQEPPEVRANLGTN